MIRQDRYQVGDKVQFTPPDEYGYSPCHIPHKHQRAYGPGPYLVTKTEDVNQAHRGVGHVQWVEVNGEQYSGAWFQPLRG